MLERWVNEPYFEKAVVGYYVRICVGEIEGQNVYRMCEIKGVHKGRKYTLTNKVGNIPSYILNSHLLTYTLIHTITLTSPQHVS